MIFSDKMRKLEGEKMYPSDRFKAQILFMTQEYLLEQRDNEPFEEWSYEKVLQKSSDHKDILV